MDSRKPYQSEGSRKRHPALRGLAPGAAVRRAHHCGGDVTGAVGLLTEDRTPARMPPSSRP